MNNNNGFVNKTLRLGKSFFTMFCSPWKKYAKFSGRARRKEIWLFTLLYLLGSMAIISIFGKGSVVSWIWYFAVLLPNTALAVRRLHDGGDSLWWLVFCCFFVFFLWLLLQMPTLSELSIIVIAIIAIIFSCDLARRLFFKRGQAGDNMYGADPRAANGSIADAAKPHIP